MTFSEGRGRKLVRDRSGGVCELLRHARATDWGHRYGRGQLGTWAPSNGLDLCHPCHMWTHHNRAAAEAGGWITRTGQPSLETPAWLAGALGTGWWFLDDEGFYLPALAPVDAPQRPVLPDWIEEALACL